MLVVPENFTALDLEMNQPSGKIIQIGAVAGNLHTGQIFEKFDVLVQLDEPLNPYITTLTGITPEDLDARAIPLDQAYNQLREFHLKHNCFLNPITWGGGDSIELKDQLDAFFDVVPELQQEYPWCFGRRWFDLKTIVQLYCIFHNIKIQGGLAKTLTKFGMRFEGRKHDATDDALNTFRLAHQLRHAFVTKHPF